VAFKTEHVDSEYKYDNNLHIHLNFFDASLMLFRLSASLGTMNGYSLDMFEPDMTCAKVNELFVQMHHTTKQASVVVAGRHPVTGFMHVMWAVLTCPCRSRRKQQTVMVPKQACTLAEDVMWIFVGIALVKS
jgi:hypothetical protein